MPSTYTTALGLEKIATGEQDGTWGDTTNTNWDLFDQAVAGQVDVTIDATDTASGTPYLLPITDGTLSEGRNPYVNVIDAGDIGGTGYIQLTGNDQPKICFISNSLTNSQSLIVFQGTYDAGRDFEILNGNTAMIRFDGQGASSSTASNMFQTMQMDSLAVTGAVTADTFTAATGIAGTLTTAAQANVTSVGTLPTLSAGAITATTVAGALITAAQTNVTSLGTLTNLDVDSININGTAITGCSNVTSTAFTGDLTGDVTGDINITTEGTDTLCYPVFVTQSNGTLPLYTATSLNKLSFNSSTGELSCTTLTGTLNDATQTAIRTVGSLTGLVVTNTTDVAILTASGTVNFSNLSVTMGGLSTSDPAVAGRLYTFDAGSYLELRISKGP